MSEELRVELRSAFANVGLKSLKDELLSQCMALSTSNAITPSQLATTWEAFSLNRNVMELTDLTFKAYRNAVIKDYDSAVMSKPGKRHGLPMVTPDAKKLQMTSSPTSAVDAIASSKDSRRVSFSPTQRVAPKTAMINMPKYEERTSVGKVVVAYHPKNKILKSEPTTAASLKPRCTVSTAKFASSNLQKPYRHMFTTLEERAKILDDQLVTMGEEIMDTCHDVAELEAVGVPRQDKVTCVGRICNEAHEGRINQTSVLLEGSRHFSNGTRVSLDLTHLKDVSKQPFSLFPGQIVAVEGMNVSGRKLVPSRIFAGATPAPIKSKVSELMRIHHDVQDGQPLKILSACGPYTTSNNLDYAPLMDLIEIARLQKPDVVLMAGPFVNISNGDTTLELEDGSKMQVTYEVFFANKFASLVEELFEKEADLQTQFVLVPSLNDAVAEWVFPQAPLADRLPNQGKMLSLPGAEGVEIGTLGLHHIENAGRESGGHRRIHCVPNPCTLQINEVVIGITSNDTIFQISADETNGNLEPGSRLTRIAQHLLQQRSYYPLFPPPAGTNLDLAQYQYCQMPCRPDILIAPSKLTCFARAVCESTLVVNPGHLTKGTTGGTYAMMSIHPIERETLENAGGDDVELEHAIQDRVSVEIKRI